MRKFLQIVRFKFLHLTKIAQLIKEQFLNIYYGYKIREANLGANVSRPQALKIKFRRVVKCLYPMTLNMTKRSQVITETLQLKGGMYSNPNDVL